MNLLGQRAPYKNNVNRMYVVKLTRGFNKSVIHTEQQVFVNDLLTKWPPQELYRTTSLPYEVSFTLVHARDLPAV